MKKLLAIILLGFLCAPVFGQNLIWEKSYGGATTRSLADCVPLPDGGFIALFSEALNTASISRLDANGDQIWNVPCAYGLRSQYGGALKLVPGGFLAGLQKFGQTVDDTVKLALVKYNLQGIEQWVRLISTGRDDNYALDLHIQSSNEYVLLGAGGNFGEPLNTGSGNKFMPIGLDSLGFVRWKHLYSEPFGAVDRPRSIVPYSSNNYIFAGSVGLNGPFPKLVKTDLNGNLIQSSVLTNTPYLNGYQTGFGNFIPVADGNIVFTGYYSPPGLPATQRYILASKMDTTFNLLWTVSYAEMGVSFGVSNVIEKLNGEILVVTQRGGDNELIYLSVSSSGQVMDTTFVEVTNITSSAGIITSFLLPDGSLIYCGHKFIAKIGNVGFPTTFTGIPSQAPTVKAQIFPNPASQQVRVQLSGAQTGLLQLYSVTGQQVVQQQVSSQSTVSLKNVPQGLYLYKLQTSGQVLSGKLVVE